MEQYKNHNNPNSGLSWGWNGSVRPSKPLGLVQSVDAPNPNGFEAGGGCVRHGMQCETHRKNDEYINPNAAAWNSIITLITLTVGLAGGRGIVYAPRR